jgi:hypothetical protein
VNPAGTGGSADTGCVVPSSAGATVIARATFSSSAGSTAWPFGPSRENRNFRSAASVDGRSTTPLCPSVVRMPSPTT